MILNTKYTYMYQLNSTSNPVNPVSGCVAPTTNSFQLTLNANGGANIHYNTTTQLVFYPAIYLIQHVILLIPK